MQGLKLLLRCRASGIEMALDILAWGAVNLKAREREAGAKGDGHWVGSVLTQKSVP